jgi:hypothetical protein
VTLGFLETVPREDAGGSLNISGNAAVSFWTVPADVDVTDVTWVKSGNQPTASTYAALGLYRAAAGTYTLLAAIEDPAMWAGTNVAVTRPLVAALEAGDAVAFVLIHVGTGTAGFRAYASTAAINDLPPIVGGVLAGETALPASFTVADLDSPGVNSTGTVYLRLGGDVTFPAPTPAPGDTWATIADARRLWPDAVAVDDATLETLLSSAYVVCVRFAAPSIALDPVPPDVLDAGIANVRMLANVYEARELWAASRRDGDVIGFDTYAVRVRPLSATVQSLLRPAHGRPMSG